MMYKIQTLNNISDVIHQSLTAERYLIAKEEPVPDGILVRSASMHDMDLPDSLLAIARAGAGTNNIPIDECTKRGIVVFNTPGANANAVAELVICGLMLGSRNVAGGIDWARTLDGQGAEVAKLVEKGKAQFAGPEVRGKTLGVIGLGAIGALVANAAAQGLGMNVIGYDPFISVESAWSLSRAIKRSSSVDEIYQSADYITVHVPLTDATRGMFGAASIAQMKDGVHLLNFSRAELADAEALAAALESGKVASYVTDFPTQAVLKMKNAIAIPPLRARSTAPIWPPASCATTWRTARSAIPSTSPRSSWATARACACSSSMKTSPAWCRPSPPPSAPARSTSTTCSTRAAATWPSPCLSWTANPTTCSRPSSGPCRALSACGCRQRADFPIFIHQGGNAGRLSSSDCQKTLWGGSEGRSPPNEIRIQRHVRWIRKPCAARFPCTFPRPRRRRPGRAAGAGETCPGGKDRHRRAFSPR